MVNKVLLKLSTLNGRIIHRIFQVTRGVGTQNTNNTIIYNIIFRHDSI